MRIAARCCLTVGFSNLPAIDLTQAPTWIGSIAANSSRPLASHQAKKLWQARWYAARVSSLAIEPKKWAKRFAARGPTSATRAGTTIGRPKALAGSTIVRLLEEVAARALV